MPKPKAASSFKLGKNAFARESNFRYIEDPVTREKTYHHVVAGLMKKCRDLAGLTGSEVVLIAQSEAGHIHSFASKKLMPVITEHKGKDLIFRLLTGSGIPQADSSEKVEGDSGALETVTQDDIPDISSLHDGISPDLGPYRLVALNIMDHLRSPLTRQPTPVLYLPMVKPNYAVVKPVSRTQTWVHGERDFFRPLPGSMIARDVIARDDWPSNIDPTLRFEDISMTDMEGSAQFSPAEGTQVSNEGFETSRHGIVPDYNTPSSLTRITRSSTGRRSILQRYSNVQMAGDGALSDEEHDPSDYEDENSDEEYTPEEDTRFIRGMGKAVKASGRKAKASKQIYDEDMSSDGYESPSTRLGGRPKRKKRNCLDSDDEEVITGRIIKPKRKYPKRPPKPKKDSSVNASPVELGGAATGTPKSSKPTRPAPKLSAKGKKIGRPKKN